MCIAVPSQIVEIVDEMATVECFDVRRHVSLMLLNDPVAVGDYVLVQAGGFACEKVDPEIAREALMLFTETFGGAAASG